MTKYPINDKAHHRLKVQLVGIAGTSRDVLLSIFALKAFVLGDRSIAESITVETNHYKYILPSKMEETCVNIALDIAQYNPDILGFSTYTWNYNAVMRIATLVKKNNPQVGIIIGGPEIASSDVIKGRFDNLPVDYIICGEGEMPFLRLLRSILSGDKDGVTGIARLSHRIDGGFSYGDINDPKADIIPNLSELPSAYLTDIIPSFLLAEGFQANVETQRGCNFRCAYCLYHANFPSIRYRNVTDVVEELDYVYRHGVKDFRITDANFLSKKDFAAEILSELIKRKIKMAFFFEVIPSFVDSRIADLMRQYRDIAPDNHILVGIGLQTINLDSLKAIRRRLPIEHFTRAFSLLSDAGVVIKTDIILGLPYETKDSYLDLLEYIGDKMRSGYNYLSLALLRVLPGSELAFIAESAGLVTSANDSEHFVYETPTMPRADLVDCLKISTVAFRFFHTLDIESRMYLRRKYFEIKDELNVSHVTILQHFVLFFEKVLSGSASDFIREDFPNAEHYWYFDIHKEVQDDTLIQELDNFLRERRG